MSSFEHSQVHTSNSLFRNWLYILGEECPTLNNVQYIQFCSDWSVTKNPVCWPGVPEEMTETLSKITLSTPIICFHLLSLVTPLFHVHGSISSRGLKIIKRHWLWASWREEGVFLLWKGKSDSPQVQLVRACQSWKQHVWAAFTCTPWNVFG